MPYSYSARAILIAVKLIQDGGILRSANTTKILGISAMIPLILIGVVPLFTGDVVRTHFFPLVPLVHDAAGTISSGSWNAAGWTAVAGAMFLAAWSTYGFETAVCYTGEFKDPKTDTFKAIFYSGLLCLVVYTIVPFAFQGYLGLGELVKPAVLDAHGAVLAPAVYSGMLAPDIASGMGVGSVMAKMVHLGTIGGAVIIVMLILAVVLSLMTSMAGSSRTLYQASVDGWLPKYLSRLNAHGAPSNAMLTNLGFNLLLLLMSDYVFVLAAANVGYLIFSFLNLNSGWIHRMDRPTQVRPWRAPSWIIAAGAVLAFVNLAFMGMGADTSGIGTLRTRPDFRSPDRAGIRVSPLHPGQGKFPCGDGSGPRDRGGADRGETRRTLAVSRAGVRDSRAGRYTHAGGLLTERERCW